MTQIANSLNITAAFHSQLNTLCIREFPCGYGSWRAPNVTSNTSLKINTEGKYSEHSAQLESVESLQGLAVKIPYNADCSWSDEAESLREIAVKTPDKLSKTYILKFFKSLRIVDKKELELAANQISDISTLCVCPPPLIHLGLSYNQISSVTGHMKATSWSNLLSLDLSFNNLTDLFGTINVLKTLPKLKNLVLQGNPLALVPGYRGYTIDSIRQLTILDDIRISADEKHFFKGLSKLKDVPLDEAQVTVSIRNIKGVKMPEEIEDPEINADYPKTEHKYHIEFRFLKAEPTLCPNDTPVCESPVLSVPAISLKTANNNKNVNQEESSSVDGISQSGDSSLLEMVATHSLPWSEEGIELDYCGKFDTRLLAPLRDYLQNGVQFTVVKTKHMYVLEDPNAQQNDDNKSLASVKSRPGSKAQKVPTKEKRKESAKGKPREGKSKKSKQEDIELFELPRTRSELGSCHVQLSPILEGELEVESECVCEGEEGTPESNKKGEGSCSKSDAYGKKKSIKDGADKPSKGNLRASTPGKNKAGHPKSSKDDKKGKEKDKHVDNNGEEEDMTPPTLPLTIQVNIKLHCWKSAREAAQELVPHNVPSQSGQN
ncbi:leucine-rich repeat-containing protein 43-like isoform X2 [Montipora foliosa]|uniref:leucine-rich repeat-containing protein 43-like isoform X2 n=1 Tax=Montipora foliosa TaxID=591990 RepID=UPI0035F11EA2